MWADLTRTWAALSDRERVLLAVGAVFGLAMALFWGVYQPLRDNRAADLARALRYERTLAALATMPVTAQAVTDPRPLAGIVTATAATQGLIILRLDTPTPDRATVTLQDTPFETLLLWIDGLGREGGVTVASATIRRAGDTGAVSADLVLTKGVP